MGSSPAIDNGIVYVGSHDRSVYALNAENGSVIWGVDLSDYGIGGEIASYPVVVDNRLFIGGGWPSDNQVYSFDARNGSLIWKFEADGYVGTPAVANGVVYFHSQIETLYALDAINGEVIWMENTGGAEGFASPIIIGDKIIDVGGTKIYIITSKMAKKYGAAASISVLGQHRHSRTAKST